MDAILFDNVTKTYHTGFRKKKIALAASLSLSIPPGEVFGFLGPNGAGKSTAIKILLNLIFPTSGRVLLFGQSACDAAIRTRIGYLPESPTVYDHLSPEELLWFGGKTSCMETSQIARRTDVLLGLVELDSVRRQRLRSFSKGMVQRVGLALALINNPDLVILDEPMSGLDPLGRRLMAAVIRQLKAEGKTVFFSSHIMRDVEDLCDCVGIIVQGRLRRVTRLVDLASIEARGWRVVLRGTAEPIRARLAGLSYESDERGGLIEVRTSERDVGKLLDRLGSFQDGIVSISPLRPTLEDIVLAEVEQAGGNAQ
ncbi:MAG: ABC transporter ATP-binding protein [Nitrospirota bacterium]